MTEDAVCENGAQEAGADEESRAERGGFLGSADVIVEFWGHLDSVGFLLAVHERLLWDLRCKITFIYVCRFLGVANWCLRLGARGCTRQQHMLNKSATPSMFHDGGVSMGRDSWR